MTFLEFADKHFDGLFALVIGIAFMFTLIRIAKQVNQDD